MKELKWSQESLIKLTQMSYKEAIKKYKLKFNLSLFFPYLYRIYAIIRTKQINTRIYKKIDKAGLINHFKEEKKL